MTSTPAKPKAICAAEDQELQIADCRLQIEESLSPLLLFNMKYAICALESKKGKSMRSSTLAILLSWSFCQAAEPTPPPYKPDPNYKPTRNLSQFFQKLRDGRPVTVMGIGGSVTEGHSWSAMSAEWLQKEFPGKQVKYVDGAWGGRGPDMTVFRFRRDPLPHKPDLVFIEYTVNCYGTAQETFKALDGMVQQLLLQYQKPEIVFVYVGNEKGERGLDKVQPLARHYGFIEVDPRAYLQKKLDAKELTWKDFSGDQIHPNQKGHAIYAEPMIEMFKEQMKLPATPEPHSTATHGRGR